MVIEALAAGADTGGVPPFLTEVAILVAAAALVSYLAQRLRLVPIMGFLVAGVLVGPNALGLVRSPEIVREVAEIGVILLLFTIGIEFSLDRLAQIRRLILLGGSLQVVLSTAAVTGVLALVGVPLATGIYSGFLVALSSTAIVLAVLGARGESGSGHGRIALGLLIFQDLAVIVMVLLVPMLGGRGGSPLALLLALGKAVALVAVVLVVARRVMPRLLDAVARTCAPEVFLLTTIAVCFVTAWATSKAGVSVSLGAFLAGLLVSESRWDHQALGEVLPLQILFSAAFFVSVGMLLDVGFVATHLPLVALVVVGVLVVKALTTAAGLVVLGHRAGLALTVGLVLAQVGEFSFVLEGIGRQAGLTPFGQGVAGQQAFVAATVLLMIATPFLTRAGLAIGGRVPERAARPAARVARAAVALGDGQAEAVRDHVVVAGYGSAARTLTDVLQHVHTTSYLVTTLNPDGATEAAERGHPVLVGDASKRHILLEAGIDRARLLVVPDDEPGVAGRIAAVARALNPALTIVVRAPDDAEVDQLRQAGADEVITAEGASAIALFVRVLHTFGLTNEDVWAEVQRATQTGDVFGAKLGQAGRIQLHPRAGVDCAHLATIHPVRPSASGCEECLRVGGRWVHLRVCMACGHVGCCDSSPGQHATGHWHQTTHPIVKSGEAGEEWGWCYEERIRL